MQITYATARGSCVLICESEIPSIGRTLLKYSCFRFQEASGEDSRIKTFVIVGQRTLRSLTGLLGTREFLDKSIISC
jgi:hypothetical protein